MSDSKPDLRQISVLVVVFGMDGCGACDAYIPKFTKQVAAAGAPFTIWAPGDKLARGQIPVLFYDASSEDPELAAFADQLKITATPTTCVLTRYGTTKVEGAIPPEQVDALLVAAQRANR